MIFQLIRVLGFTYITGTRFEICILKNDGLNRRRCAIQIFQNLEKLKKNIHKKPHKNGMFDKYNLLEFLLFGWVMRSTTKHPKTFETIPRCALVTGSNCKSIVKIHCLGNRPIRHYSNLENIPLLWNSGCGTITS